MNTQKMEVFASTIGSKLQTEFFKLFSGKIEDAEIVHNEPVLNQLQPQPERFLDRT